MRLGTANVMRLAASNETTDARFLGAHTSQSSGANNYVRTTTIGPRCQYPAILPGELSFAHV